MRLDMHCPNSCNCSFIFIYQVTLAGEVDGTPALFESSEHLLLCLPHTVEASHCPFYCWASSREACAPIFITFSLILPGIELKCTTSVADTLPTWPMVVSLGATLYKLYWWYSGSYNCSNQTARNVRSAINNFFGVFCSLNVWALI